MEPICAQKGPDLELSGIILEPTGAQFAGNCFDSQALICSAPEFVNFADLGYPARFPSEVELVGDVVYASASELLELGFPVSSPSVVEPAGDLVPVTASTPFT